MNYNRPKDGLSCIVIGMVFHLFEIMMYIYVFLRVKRKLMRENHLIMKLDLRGDRFEGII